MGGQKVDEGRLGTLNGWIGDPGRDSLYLADTPRTSACCGAAPERLPGTFRIDSGYIGGADGNTGVEMKRIWQLGLVASLLGASLAQTTSGVFYALEPIHDAPQSVQQGVSGCAEEPHAIIQQRAECAVRPPFQVSTEVVSRVHAWPHIAQHEFCLSCSSAFPEHERFLVLLGRAPPFLT